LLAEEDDFTSGGINLVQWGCIEAWGMKMCDDEKDEANKEQHVGPSVY
jgi:hypothetical protein